MSICDPRDAGDSFCVRCGYAPCKCPAPPTDARPGETTDPPCSECTDCFMAYPQFGPQAPAYSCPIRGDRCVRFLDVPLSPPAARGAEGTTCEMCAGSGEGGDDEMYCPECAGSGKVAAHPEPTPGPDATLRAELYALIMAAHRAVFDWQGGSPEARMSSMERLRNATLAARAALAQEEGR